MSTVKTVKSGIAALLALSVAAVALVPLASAQTSEQATLDALQAQIQSLLEQIESLNRQIVALQSETETLRAEVDELTEQLKQGSRGEEVEDLQEFLASDPEIYPEGLVTGYFGHLTEEAVKRFQEKHGIETVGEVGPKTRARINQMLTKGVGPSGFVPPGLQKKFGVQGVTFETEEDATVESDEEEEEEAEEEETVEEVEEDGTVTYVTVCHIPPGNPAAKHTIVVGSPALPAHLGHGDTEGPCEADQDGEDGEEGEDDEGNGGDTDADTTAPAISGLAASNVGTTTALVEWSTDEPADSSVWVATTSPVTSGNGTHASDTSFLLEHEVGLDGLTASTTYFFMVSSTDETGNTATSSEQSFTTL